jgi:2'-5' RNA ligase
MGKQEESANEVARATISGGTSTSMKSENLWPNYYDIVILPPPAIRDHAIELSRKLERYGGKFVLATESFLPHISLYHIPVQPQRFEAFCNTVRDIASRSAGGVLRLVSIDMPVLMTDKPDWLILLHEHMVGRTVTFLDREYGAAKTWNIDYLPAELTTAARRYLVAFGSPLINEVFRPHITLTSFEDKNVAKVIPPLDCKPLSFDVDSVSICELGPSHSCQRTLATYPLMSGKKAL